LIEAAVAHAATLRGHAQADASDEGARVTEAEAARWQAMADAAKIELAAFHAH